MSAVKIGFVAVVSSLTVMVVVALMTTGISSFFSRPQQSSYDLGNGLRLERIQTLESTSSRVNSREVGGMAWSRDGRMLASYSELGNLVTIWSIDGRKLKEFRREGDGPYVGNSIAFLLDGRTVVTPAVLSSGEDNRYSLSLWNAKTGQLEHSVEGPWPDKPSVYNRPYKFALSPDGRSVAAINFNFPPVAVVYLTQDWHIQQKIGASDKMSDFGRAVAFSPDSRILAIGGMRGDLTLLDLRASEAGQTNLEVYAPTYTTSVGALAFSPDAAFLATGAHFDANIAPGQDHDPVKIWRVSDHSLFATYPGEPVSVHDLSWSTNGHYLAAAMSDKKLQIFLPGGSQRSSGFVDFDGRAVNSVSFSPDGEKLAVGVGATVSIFSLHHE